MGMASSVNDPSFVEVGNWSELTPKEKQQVSRNIAAIALRDCALSIPRRSRPEFQETLTSTDRLDDPNDNEGLRSK